MCSGSQIFYVTGAIGCVISNTAGVVMIFDFFNEIYERRKYLDTFKVKAIKKDDRKNILYEKKINNKLLGICSVLIVSILFLEGITGIGLICFENSLLEEFLPFLEHNKLECVEKRPFKGIYMPEAKLEEYNNIIDDLDLMKSKSPGKIMVTERIPWIYLYVNEPYPVFSAWDQTFDWNFYKQYFEKTSNYPENIYIPYSDFYYSEKSENCEEAKAYFTKLFNCTIENGKYGYILNVKQID